MCLPKNFQRMKKSGTYENNEELSAYQLHHILIPLTLSCTESKKVEAYKCEQFIELNHNGYDAQRERHLLYENSTRARLKNIHKNQLKLGV